MTRRLNKLEVVDKPHTGIRGSYEYGRADQEVLWIPIDKENQFNTITLSDETLGDLIELLNNNLKD